jgi:hypothetical protein
MSADIILLYLLQYRYSRMLPHAYMQYRKYQVPICLSISCCCLYNHDLAQDCWRTSALKKQLGDRKFFILAVEKELRCD